MFVPQIFPQNLEHQEHSLSEQFSLLVWNIHKENQQLAFQTKLTELLQDNPSDFILFQEVKYPKTSPYSFENYSYTIASNIETSNNIFGVLTAAKVSFEQINTHITTKREMGVATRKSLLITQHRLSSGEILHMVNLHAINFVSLKSFTLELEKIKIELLQYSGAMIIGGDFNNWSTRRVKVLEAFQKDLSLEKADVDEYHHIKHVFSKPLDHIFYRGVKLIKAEAIDTKKISDHNPIYASFTTKQTIR